ncbi:MAG TPA: TonB-dependent receptor plug domain-containing protein [Opitutaceae bacterium]|nr:TonB-dependent receptor plug domain-containing protein [Opitutaceae bacterium]
MPRTNVPLSSVASFAADSGTFVLDPFEVRTSKDTSYGALNSVSITRFNTELNKVPLSADIYTSAFMQDVDLTTIDGLLQQYGGAQMAFANPAGQVNLNQPGDRNTTSGFTFRGLASGPIRLNGFVTESSNFVNTTNFDVERVEVIHGPQGLLYGPGGAGGTIVATTLQAKFDQQSGRISERIDQYGSKRTIVQANAGNDRIAGTFAILDEDSRYRRLFYGGDGRGYYGQVAFRLPFRTTLRVDATYTHQDLVDTIGTTSVSFGGAANDRRNGYQLANLLLTDKAGVNDPATGTAYSKYGAIDNGQLSWENLYSFPGAANWEIATNSNIDVIADTVWTSWLSTNIGFNYNRLNDLFGSSAGALSAPLQNGNPLNAWAMNYTPSESMNNKRHKNFRASALLTNNLFHGRARSQTTFGYDFQRQGTGGTGYGYYLADAQGNEILTPGGSNLGRKGVPQQWWSVDQGPVFMPPVFFAHGGNLYRSPQDGQYYVKDLVNPRSPAYITPANPLGLYSLATGPNGALLHPGVNGQDLPDYEKEITSSGLYLANFTSWWDDLFTTMFGYRYTYTANHIPSGAAATVVVGPVDTSKFGAASYNLGIDGRITRWLRWYYGYSANYNVANSQTDFYGQPDDTSYGKGQEIGLKFTPLDGRISGSADYYINKNTNYAVNAGNPVLNSINPSSALNGDYNGIGGASTFVPEDYTSKGVELTLNANPVPNWRVHFSANFSDGYVQSSATYGILYNDEFHTDGHGNVTYANGAPFLVPTTPGVSVTKLSSAVNPNTTILNGVPSTQLTTAMIGDPKSPYYAWQGTTVTTNGQIAPASNVYKVLKYFDVPGAGTALTGRTGLPISAIQYAWPDPGQTGGSVIVTQAGEKTVGYPEFQLNLVNTYQFNHGPLKGFGVVVAVSRQWAWRNFYYNTPASPGQPLLWRESELGWQFNLNPFYEHKFGRYVWRTQLNITNLTNHYRVEITPNNGLGFTAANALGVRWDNQPRSISWTNTISF